MFICINSSDPVLFEEAMEHANWVVAMHEEIEVIHWNNTWELICLLERKKDIDLKWIYKMKFNPDGSILRKRQE